MSISVFSIELFLKSLLVLHGAHVPKVHKLAELVALLPAEELVPVKYAYHQVVQKPSFEELVGEISELFMKLRYEFEFNIFSLNEFPVFTLAEALYIHCARRHGSQSEISNFRV